MLRLPTLIAIGLCSLTATAAEPAPRSPYQIVEQAPAAHWRNLEPDNSLYIELATGTVVVELFPGAAPANSANVRALVREGFYDGLSIYRVVDGFVAQGGDVDDTRAPKTGSKTLPGEFSRQGPLPGPYTPVNKDDGFAPETGFVEGFPIGRDGDTWWLLHCPGAVGLAREDAIDSGGSEFYFVLGHAPRYLDRNVTMLGMVRHGMEHVQKLNRGHNARGAIEPARRNPIARMRVASDMPAAERLSLQVMRTDSASFAELVRSRASRPEPWFVYRPGHVDTCGVPVPTRLF